MNNASLKPVVWIITITLLLDVWLLWWMIRIDLFFRDVNYGTIITLIFTITACIVLWKKSWQRTWIPISLLSLTLLLWGWLYIDSHRTTSGSSNYPSPSSIPVAYPKGNNLYSMQDIWKYSGQPIDARGHCPPGYTPTKFIHLSEASTYIACK